MAESMRLTRRLSGKNVVRPLTSQDKQDFLTLSKSCYDEMDFDSMGYEYDKDHISNMYDMKLGRDMVIGYFDSGLKGIMVASITDVTAFFKGKLIAQEIVWHAAPSLNAIAKIKIMKKLVVAALEILKERGVKSFYINTDARYKTLNKMLIKLGFTPVSTALYKGI